MHPRQLRESGKLDRTVSLSSKGHPNSQMSRVLCGLPGLRNIARSRCNCVTIATVLRFLGMSCRIISYFLRFESLWGFVQLFLSVGNRCCINNSNIKSCLCPKIRDLSDNNLTGPIPPELGKLTQLVLLKLYGNQLNGKIPISSDNSSWGINNLTSLRML